MGMIFVKVFIKAILKKNNDATLVCLETKKIKQKTKDIFRFQYAIIPWRKKDIIRLNSAITFLRK